MSVTFSIRGVESNFETGENWVNFANVNARTVLDLLGICVADDSDLWGEIVNLDVVIRRAMRVLNNEHRDYGTPGFEIGGDGHARLIQCEITDESVRRRIQAVLNLCVEAKRIGTTVVFG